MLNFIKKYKFSILILILLILFNFSDIKTVFKNLEYETTSTNGVNLKIYTNWFKFNDEGYNNVQIKNSLKPNISSQGIYWRSYIFGETRPERIASIKNVEWLKNDSLIIIHSELKNKERKIDSLFWLKNPN